VSGRGGWPLGRQASGPRDGENRHLEELAAEAEWLDQFNGSILTGHCLNCGDRCDDLTVHGLCDRCDTAATEATIACVNGAHGLGHRVF
jgi:hypothetical protein